MSCSNGSAQLLGVPPLQSGEGKSQARAVYDALQSWNIEDKVQGMCFDTTASNTGSNEGACVYLEKLLGRDLLHIACRHHILELLPAAAFKKVMGDTSNPEVLLFKRFQAQWEHLDTQSYDDYSTDETVFHALCDVRESLVLFLHSSLEKNQPRDDYREIVEITAIFLGCPPPRGAHFMSPGPMHHARWMSKVIYSLKVWLFRKQFRMTPREEKGLRDLSIFFVRVYVKAWICAPFATKAPQNDLTLLKSLVRCEKIHPRIAACAAKKLASHLWYLSEELVALSLLDDDVPPNVKDQMVRAMNEVNGAESPRNRAQVSFDTLMEKTVAHFATKRTKTFFTKLNIPSGFLKIPADQWNDHDDYKTAKRLVGYFSVTNDHAERGIAMIQQFTGCITKSEEQLQFLMQVVSEHRKRYPDANKKTLIS